MFTDETLIPERRSFPWRWLAVVVIVALLAGAGVILWPSLHRASPTQHYLTAPVQRTTLADTVSATGPIVAPAAVPLNFKNSGKVAEIDVKVGDLVKAGQVLARLDPTDLEAQLRQAEANRDAAQATYQELVDGATTGEVETAQAAVDAAGRQVSDASGGLTAAQKQAATDVSLAKAGVGTARTNLANARAALQKAQAEEATTLSADQTAIANAQKNLSAVQAAVAANLPVLEQQVEKAKDDLYAQQVSRDATCGRGPGAACTAANASVFSAETAVNTAQAQLGQSQKQGAQQVAQAQAQLDQAKAQLSGDRAKEGAAVSAAAGQVKQTEDALITAGRGATDAQAKATAALQAAGAQVNAATSAAENARASYDKTTSPPTAAQLANARAQVAAQQALVDLARANLDAAVLKAPSDGVVTAINGAVGQWLTGGSTSGAAASAASGANNSSSNNATNFINLTDLTDLQIQAQVNEADVGRLKAGQAVAFTVDAFPGQTFNGDVAVVQSLGATNQNVVTYPVLIAIPPTSAHLLPGMTASVTITVDRRPNVLVVPSAAISFAQAQLASKAGGGPTSENAGPSVLLVDSTGQTKLQPIQTGASDGQNTEVVSGLTAGQRVAIGLQE